MNSFLAIGLPLFVLGAIQIVFGLLCIFRNKNKNLPQYYTSVASIVSGIFCWSVGLYYVQAAFGLDYSRAYRFGYVAWLIVPPLLQMVQTMRGGTPRWLSISMYLLYPLWIGVLYLCVTTDLISLEPLTLWPFEQRMGPYDDTVVTFGCVMLIYLLVSIIKARKESTGVKREKYSYFLLGIIIYAIWGLITNIPFGGQHLDPGLTAYFSIPWVGITLYAVSRYRLFDIRLIFTKLISAFVLTVIFATIHIGLFGLIHEHLSSMIAISLTSLVTAIVAFATPIVEYVKDSADSFFFKKEDHEQGLKKGAEALVSIFNLDDLIRRFTQISRNNLGVQEACFFLVENEKLKLRYSLGLENEAGPTEINIEGSLVSQLKNKKQILIFEEEETRMPPAALKELKKDFSKVSIEMIIPIFYKENLTGILCLGGKTNKDAFHQKDIVFMETLASQVALAIENVHLLQEATTDGLTGLYHQKYFKSRMRSEFERSKRHKKNLVLLLVDIDFFKKINDTYGHLAGDDVLKNMAKILQNSFRVEDVLARYGGEEFAVLLAEPDPTGALEAAERLRKRVEAHPFPHDIKVTISVGMYVFDYLSNTSSELEIIDRADKALYEAKHSGRNRVVVFDDPQKLKRVV